MASLEIICYLFMILKWQITDRRICRIHKKGKKMNDLIALLQGLSASIAALQAQLVDAQAAAQAQYDKGFADGKASVSGDFTQADIDAAVKAAVDPLNAQILDLQGQLSGVQGQIDAAVLQAKSDLKVAVKALIASEDADAQGKVDAL